MRLHFETTQQLRKQDDKQTSSFKQKFLKKTKSILAYAKNLHFHEDHRASVGSKTSSSSSNKHTDVVTTVPSDKQLSRVQLSQCRIASQCFLSEGEDRVDTNSVFTNKEISNHSTTLDFYSKSDQNNEEFVQQHPCIMEHQLQNRQMIPLQYIRNQQQPCNCHNQSLIMNEVSNRKSYELNDPFVIKLKEGKIADCENNNISLIKQLDLQSTEQCKKQQKLSQGQDGGIEQKEGCQQKEGILEQQNTIHKLIESQQEEQLEQIHSFVDQQQNSATRVQDTNSDQLNCSSDEGDIIKPTGSRFEISVGIEGEDEDDEDDEYIHNFNINKNENDNQIHKEFPSSLTKVKQINFMEAWLRVKTMDLSREKKVMEDIKKSAKSERKLGVKKKGLIKKLFQMCTVIPLLHSSGSPSLSDASLQQEMDQILAYSSQSIDLDDKLHQSMIGSIYCQLRNTDHCPLLGQHWLTIGFRHPSPKYNFDIAGIFGALQILAFIFCYKEYLIDALAYIDSLENQNQEESKISVVITNEKKRRKSNVEKESYQDGRTIGTVTATRKTLGSQPTFPEMDSLKSKQKEINLCLVMQEISKLVLQLLERRQLSHMILAEKSVIGVVNKVYFAVFVLYFEKFKLEKSGVETSRNILKSTMEYVIKHTQEALDVFKKQISSFYKNKD